MLVFAASKRRLCERRRARTLGDLGLGGDVHSLGRGGALAGELGAADGLLGAEREGGGDGGHGDVGTRVRL